jgi:hypothetical protein
VQSLVALRLPPPTAEISRVCRYPLAFVYLIFTVIITSLYPHMYADPRAASPPSS